MCFCLSAVSQSIQAINEAVDSGDPAQTLAALRNPGAGLYGVTSECAQTYQNDLDRIKKEKKAEGEQQEMTGDRHCGCTRAHFFFHSVRPSPQVIMAASG